MISIEKIDTLAGLETLEEPWTALLSSLSISNVFLTYEWCISWWKIYGSKRQLYLLLIKSDEALIGIAPLMISTVQRLGRTGRVIEFIGYPDAECQGFIGNDLGLIFQTVIRYLNENRQDWTKIYLPRFRAADRNVLHFEEALGRQGLKYWNQSSLNQEGEEAGKVSINADSLRQSKEAAEKMFEPDEHLTIDVLADGKEIDSNLPVLFQLHINSKRNAAIPSKFSDSAYRRFYYELVKRFSPHNRISLTRLRLRDIPVAYSFNILGDGVASIFMVAANPLFAGRSPELLISLMQADIFSKEGYRVELSRTIGFSGDIAAGMFPDIFGISIYRSRIEYAASLIKGKLASIIIVKRISANDKIKAVLDKTNAIFIKGGFATLFIRLIKKVIESAMNIICIHREYYVYRHEGGLERILRIKVNIEIRKFGVEDINRIATFYGIMPGGGKYETLKKRFDKGADCYVALHHGYAVSMIWGLHHEDYHRELNLSLKPKPGEVVLSDALTSPIYRSMGIAPVLLANMLNDYHKDGHVAIAGILTSNRPSRKGLETFNFRHIYTMRILKIFGIRII